MFDNKDLKDLFEIEYLNGSLIDDVKKWNKLKFENSPLTTSLLNECTFLQDLEVVDMGYSVGFYFDSIDKGYNEDQNFYFMSLKIEKNESGLFSIIYSNLLVQDWEVVDEQKREDLDLDFETLIYYIRTEIFENIVDFSNLVRNKLGDSNFFIRDKSYVVFNPQCN